MSLSVPLLVLAMMFTATADDAASNPQVTFHTTKGDIVFELFPQEAPITVENFLAYSKSGHFVGTIFHRVMPGFIIQGGGFDADMKQLATQPPIKNESEGGLSNARGTISMARLPGRADSATAQFFVNLRDNSSTLDHPSSDGAGYAVFGKVVEGLDVAEAISNVPTGYVKGHRNVPREPILVERVSISE